MLARLMPPVGMKRSPGKGAAMALIMGRPPLASAGKNLTTSSPSCRARIMSLGVAQPGSAVAPRSRVRVMIAFFQPGADDEAGAGRDGDIDLLAQHDGAGADEGVGMGPAGRADGIGCGRRAEGDLGHRQPAILERTDERGRIGRIVDDDDRHDTGLLDLFEDGAHGVLRCGVHGSVAHHDATPDAVTYAAPAPRDVARLPGAPAWPPAEAGSVRARLGPGRGPATPAPPGTTPPAVQYRWFHEDGSVAEW